MFAMKTFVLLSLFLMYAAGQDSVPTDVPPTTTATPTPTPTPTKPAPANGSTPETPLSTGIPLTTVKPSGDDEAPVKTYSFAENGTTCLLVQMAVKLNFTFNQTYPEGNQTKYRMVDVMWNLPNETRVSNMSSCSVNKNTSSQRLVLQFFQDYAYFWNLTLHFSKDSDKVKVDNITLEYKEDRLRFTNLTMPTDTDVSTTAHSADFTWSETGFKCSSMEDVTGFPRGNMTKLNDIKTFDVKIEAFRKKSDGNFGKDFTYCPADTTVSNIVPIAVGAALAGLVLIVLVAYLIGRSRNKRGYESV